jgi:hypothetical protein
MCGAWAGQTQRGRGGGARGSRLTGSTGACASVPYVALATHLCELDCLVRALLVSLWACGCAKGAPYLEGCVRVAGRGGGKRSPKNSVRKGDNAKATAGGNKLKHQRAAKHSITHAMAAASPEPAASSAAGPSAST